MLEQLDLVTTFHLEKFVFLLDTLKIGKSNMIPVIQTLGMGI